MSKTDLTFIGISIIALLVVNLVNEAIGLSVRSFGLLLLANILVVFGFLFLKRKLTYEFLFIGLVILFIFSKFVAGLIESDPRFYSQTDLFAFVNIPDAMTKNIFLLYAILVNILWFISILLPINYSVFDHTKVPDRKWINTLIIVNASIIVPLFLSYCAIQFYYLRYIFEVGYLGVFDSSSFWGQGYRDLTSRALYVNYTILAICHLRYEKKSSRLIILSGVIFLVLEILPGQRGQVVFFIMSLFAWHSIFSNKRFNSFKAIFAGIAIVILLVFLDLLRGSKAITQSIVSYILNGFGMPLNLHQFGLYYSNALGDDNHTYSLYGISEYFDRLFNPESVTLYSSRSEALMDKSSYLGHNISGIVNYEAWLKGYGTGSAFLVELGVDVGYMAATVIMAIIFFCFRLYSRFLYSNASPTGSLIYITLMSYMLFLPRGSLSNAFPEIISVLIYWSCITFLVAGVGSVLSKPKYGDQQ